MDLAGEPLRAEADKIAAVARVAEADGPGAADGAGAACTWLAAASTGIAAVSDAAADSGRTDALRDPRSGTPLNAEAPPEATNAPTPATISVAAPISTYAAALSGLRA